MKSEVKKRVTTRKILNLSEGLLSTITDAILFSLFLPAASLGTPRSSAGVYQTFQQAHELLQDINYHSLKHAFYRLRKKGFIKALRRSFLEFEITALGYQRLNSLLPQYQEKRPWNKMIYLISYDISIKNNPKRLLLRELLLKLGAAKLQASLYLCPYNPKKILKKFIEKHQVKGQILVSTLGPDSSIGDLDLKELISKVYRLEELNERYYRFLQKYKNSPQNISITQVALDFYNILRDDPQLPFELLPRHFLSDEAYLLFRKLTS